MTKNTKKQKKNEKTITTGKGKFEKFLDFLTRGITPYCIIAAIIFGVYFQTLSYGITRLDDDKIIKNANSIIHKNNIFEAFKTDAFLSYYGSEFYRPIQSLSFIIDSNLGENNLVYFHLTNLVLHIINCCLVFYLIFLFSLDKRISLILTLIFSTHPLLNQAVIWLPSRGDLLVTLFIMISFISFIKYTNSKNFVFLIINLACFFLAVFSKEIAVLLPIIFMIYVYLKEKDIKKTLQIYNILVFIFYIIIIFIYLIIRSNVVKTSLNSNEFGIFPFVHNLPVFPEFISKFLFPYNLSVLPEFNLITILTGIIIASVVIYILIKNKIKYETFRVLFFCWFILFTVTTLFYRHEHLDKGYDYLEHRAYLPFIGILVITGSVLLNKKKNQLIFSTLCVIFIVFTSVTLARVSIFKNPEAFFTSAIDNGTRVALAYNNRGNLRKDKGDKQGANEDYNKAIEIKSDFAEAYNNRGIIRNGIRDAINDFSRAIEIKSDFAEAYNNRGNKLALLKDYSGSKKDYNKAIELIPIYISAINNRGLLETQLGNLDGAMKDFNKIIEIEKNNDEAYFLRGNVRILSGDKDGAKADYLKAIQLNPSNDRAYHNLGFYYFRNKDYSMALNNFEKALQINPNYLDAMRNIAYAKLNLGDKQGACEMWGKAFKMGDKASGDNLEKFCK